MKMGLWGEESNKGEIEWNGFCEERANVLECEPWEIRFSKWVDGYD